VVALSSVSFCASTTQDNLNVLRGMVHQAESELKNCTITSQSIVEEPSSPSWRIVQVAQVEAIYENVPDGRNLIKFNRLSSPWIGGPRDVSEDIVTVAFDGRKGASFYLQHGTPGVREGILEPDRPALLDLGALASGWSLSLYGVFQAENIRFSQALSGQFQVAVQDCARLEDGTFEVDYQIGSRKYAAKLDSLRNYALVEKREYWKDDLVDRVIVSDFFQPTRNIYYPKRAVREVLEHGIVKRRVTYEGSEIKVNLALPASSFEIVFPPGTEVQDTISNRSFTISASDDVLHEQLQHQADQVLAKIPASASTEGAQPRGHKWWVIGGTIAAVVFVLLAIRRRLAPRRLTKHSIIFVGLLPLLLNSTLIWADVTVPLDQLITGHVANCGLAATALVLSLNKCD
jgi:hypothetical protein